MSFDGSFDEFPGIVGSDGAYDDLFATPSPTNGLRRVVAMKAIKDAVLVGLRRRAQTDPPSIEGAGALFTTEVGEMKWTGDDVGIVRL